MDRAPGLSVRLEFTLSYAGFLMVAGASMLAAMWVSQYVPDAAIIAIGRFVPDLLRDDAPRAAAFTRERVDLSLIAEEATETLPPLAEKRGLTIETSGDMTPAIGGQARQNPSDM